MKLHVRLDIPVCRAKVRPHAFQLDPHGLEIFGTHTLRGQTGDLHFEEFADLEQVHQRGRVDPQQGEERVSYDVGGISAHDRSTSVLHLKDTTRLKQI